MRERSVTFNDGTYTRDLVSDLGLVYSSFEEELPQPKVIKVEIPAGADLDITESVGRIAYHNGTHKFRFLLYGDTQQERLDKKREVLKRLHGKRGTYVLSWEPDYIYTGRWTADVKHFTDNADLFTFTVDRYPWKVSEELTADINSHPVGTYMLSGSERYSDVSIRVRQAATVEVGSGTPFTFDAAGRHDLYASLFGDNLVTVTVSDWWQYLDGTNLVVNPDKITISGSDAQFNADWVLNGTDLYCANEAKQHSTLYYTRKDV